MAERIAALSGFSLAGGGAGFGSALGFASAFGFGSALATLAAFSGFCAGLARGVTALGAAATGAAFATGFTSAAGAAAAPASTGSESSDTVFTPSLGLASLGCASLGLASVGVTATGAAGVGATTGALTGYFTVEGHPVASEDGMSFWDDGVAATVTIRDANGIVVQSFGGDGSVPPIGGVRLVPGQSGYDEMLAFLAAHPQATPEPGTPTS